MGLPNGTKDMTPDNFGKLIREGSDTSVAIFNPFGFREDYGGKDMIPIEELPRDRVPLLPGAVERLISAPDLNLANFSSPTEARYARMSDREEIARERELQKVYEHVWLPPPVKHAPWD